MTVISMEQAFDAYEAARHRLPLPATPAPTPQEFDTLGAIADRFDVFLLDAFGVLNIGESPIPGAPERVAELKRAGKRVMVVSNAASVPLDALLQKYHRLGYDFAAEDVITSRQAMIAGLNGSHGLHWGVMAPDGAALEDLAIPHLSCLSDDPAAFASVEGFLLVGSGSWTRARQALLEEALLNAPRPVFVANPDIVAPREHGLTMEPGHFAHQLADRTGIIPQFFGKPFANIYDLAFDRLPSVDKERIVMVGDSLHTDILGAQTVGIRSALIAGFGFLAGQDARRAITQAGIAPDYILGRP
jgi:HAD superfamily hydrolase (TIGR01459 family)